MTLQEAAELLNLSPDTLRSQIRRRTLRAQKWGRDWHVSAREVERYRRENLGRIGRPKGARNRKPG